MIVNVMCMTLHAYLLFCAGTRQQMNVITSFIDASQIYGSTTEEMVDLRTNTDGISYKDVHFLNFTKMYKLKTWKCSS